MQSEMTKNTICFECPHLDAFLEFVHPEFSNKRGRREYQRIGGIAKEQRGREGGGGKAIVIHSIITI